jgi:hypothetical protein
VFYGSTQFGPLEKTGPSQEPVKAVRKIAFAGILRKDGLTPEESKFLECSPQIWCSLSVP